MRRRLRYSERHFKKKILYGLLKDHGVKAMPDSVYEFYSDAALNALHPRINPVNFWFNLATLRRLRAKLATSPPTP